MTAISLTGRVIIVTGGGRGFAMRADVGQWSQCQKVVEQTVSTFGAAHILVNNAARGPRYTSEQRGPFWEADPEGWRGVVDTNINGPFYMAKAVAPHLLAANWGRIINVSKTRDSMHAAKITPYGMSKAALEAATLSWAQDFTGTGVTVNSLAPGSPTDSGFETEDYWREAREAGRLRPAAVMVEPVFWLLASKQSDAITGCRYIADRWDASLPPAQAAEQAREPAIFIAPSKRLAAKKERPSADLAARRRGGPGQGSQARGQTMTKISLKGKVVIVTGGGRGLGRAMALGFARAGALGVTVTSSPRSPSEARAVAGEIEDILGPGRGLAVKADVGDWKACKRTISAIIRKWGTLHILVNNAGRAARVAGNERQPFWHARPGGWENVIATNVNGPFFMAKAALPYLARHRRARIINVSKTRDAMFGPRSAPYGPSKAALESMTLAFAQDLLGTGITVNSLAPGGSSDTNLGSAAMKRENLKVKTLLAPEIMVAPALWLASSLSDGVTGCRFIAKDWDGTLPPEQAAEGAREAAAFLPPTGGMGKLDRTWKPRGRGK